MAPNPKGNPMNFRTLLLPAALLALAAHAHAAKPAAEPADATLTITSDPEGATLFIDREPAGTTPATRHIPPGEHLVTLQKPGHTDTFATVTAQPGMQHTLNLRMEPESAWVLLHTSPQGAEVTADGISFGTTPALIKVLPPAAKTFTFTLAGHQTKTIQLDIPDQAPLMSTTELLSDSGTLVITSDPEGATILINGIQRGATPATIGRLSEPDIQLELQADGYQTLTHSLRLGAGETQALDLTLTPKPATLSVSSIPDGARVYVNNAFQGTAPLTLNDLPPGSYRVRAELAGHDPDARTYELQRGATQAAEFRLASNLGRLEITTEPAGVTLYVDGKKGPDTAADPGQTTQVSNPTPVEQLTTGTHELRLVRKGYKELRDTITIERNRTFTKHYTLERLFIPDFEVRTTKGLLFRGVLDARTKDFIRLETHPGVMKTIPAGEINSSKYLRDDEK